MESIQIFITGVMNIITTVLGASGFSGTLLLAPFVLWVIRQVVLYFKVILRSSYKW